LTNYKGGKGKGQTWKGVKTFCGQRERCQVHQEELANKKGQTQGGEDRVKEASERMRGDGGSHDSHTSNRDRGTLPFRSLISKDES